MAAGIVMAVVGFQMKGMLLSIGVHQDLFMNRIKGPGRFPVDKYQGIGVGDNPEV
jgi:hypothetical protein